MPCARSPSILALRNVKLHVIAERIINGGLLMWANLGAHSGDHDAARQAASSQVMAKITGTESSVATKIVSRAKITPRS
jgi:hypothetical protein